MHLKALTQVFFFTLAEMGIEKDYID